LPDEARLIGAFILALAGSLAVTPLAISVATRADFTDRPIGYKRHGAPTPYLGGAAVVAGFLLAGLTGGGDLARLAPIVVCAFVLWVLGTVDDRLNLSASVRMSDSKASRLNPRDPGLKRLARNQRG
jgi:UDP-GlcNAc:undecaprenyl-phosphate/decaprenyl-phosphate GlcNAc-1-phosphate transferase